MKVLHLLQSDRFSGAENVVCQIISMFKEDNDIEMIYCSQDGQIRDALNERHIKFVPMKKLCYSEVKRVINKIHPDIIHAHDMGASFYAALACGKVPMISHIHNNSFDSRKLSIKAIAYLIAVFKSKHIFWVSDTAYNGYYFHSFSSPKSSVLYNIININELYAKMKQDKNSYDYDVIFLGRLTYPKNPQRLMEIMRIIVAWKKNIKIAIVGTGDLEEEVQEICKKYGLSENISFLGFQENPLKILFDSKVMVMTSRWEGTPMCALEAMALGVPIVSTPTDGLKALIERGKNGYLSSDNNKLAEAIIKIVSSEEIRNQMKAAQLQKSLELNDIDNYVRILRDVYNKFEEKP